MTAKKPSSNRKAVKPDYKPTDQERKAIDAVRKRQEKRGELPRLLIEGDSQPYGLSVEHEDTAVGMVTIMDALGASDPVFSEDILAQLVNISATRGTPNERTLNFLLSTIKDIKPKDAIETMLATQMAAVHLATVTFARRLNSVDTIQQQDSAEKAFNKLARTFTAQVEALKRYRTGGEQKVTVQHVNVNDGGQAVVGNVTAEAKTGRG